MEISWTNLWHIDLHFHDLRHGFRTFVFAITNSERLSNVLDFTVSHRLAEAFDIGGNGDKSSKAIL